MKLFSRLKALWSNRKTLFSVLDLLKKVKKGDVQKGVEAVEKGVTVVAALLTLLEVFKGSVNPKTYAIVFKVLTELKGYLEFGAKKGGELVVKLPEA